MVAVIELNGTSTLYIPNCGKERAKWMFSSVDLTQENAKNLGFDKVVTLGTECVGYQFHPFFPRAEYDFFLKALLKYHKEDKAIFTLIPDNPREYIDQRFLIERIKSFVPELHNSFNRYFPAGSTTSSKKR